MKTILLSLATLLIVSNTGAQTLFTYGPYSVDAKEFLAAYKKNNTGPVTDKAKSMRHYLDLFIQSKIKVRDAYDRHLDTMPAFTEELGTLRSQVIQNYLTDPESFNKLMNEAFTRSRKDIRTAHIFLPRNGKQDTDSNWRKIQEAYKMLQKGQPFASVAKLYSADPSVVNNGGDIGYLTAFSLPYSLENVLYGTPVGKYSVPFVSASGYHIFKNLGERKAVGRIRTAQILLAFPPGADAAAKKRIAALADSLYQRIIKGADFGELAKQYSNDYLSAAMGGQMTEFGLGTYDPVFENAAFLLAKDGAVSKPVLTAHGYHIIKRISKSEVPASLSDKTYAENLKYRVQNDNRIEQTKELLYTKIVAKAGLKDAAFDMTDLGLYTDSLLDGRLSGKHLSVQSETPLFKIGNRMITALDFMGYAQTNRHKRDGSGLKTYPEILQDFKRFAAMEYYKENLEQFNPEFRQQMNEFKDGNLFFEVMMQKIWTPAQTDTAGQAQYYALHKKDYVWKESAGGIIFYCGDSKTAEEVRTAIVRNPSDYENILKQFGDRITAETGRYEYGQIPRAKNEVLKPNMVTSIEKNAADESASFAYIKKIFAPNEPKSFEDAKGAVINDFQAELDASWVKELKKKYPVKVDESVFAKISK